MRARGRPASTAKTVSVTKTLVKQTSRGHRGSQLRLECGVGGRVVSGRAGTRHARDDECRIGRTEQWNTRPTRVEAKDRDVTTRDDIGKRAPTEY